MSVIFSEQRNGHWFYSNVKINLTSISRYLFHKITTRTWFTNFYLNSRYSSINSMVCPMSMMAIYNILVLGFIIDKNLMICYNMITLKYKFKTFTVFLYLYCIQLVFCWINISIVVDIMDHNHYNLFICWKF